MKYFKLSVVLFFAVLLLLPVYFMVTSSVKPLFELSKSPPTLWPESIDFGSYKVLFKYPVGLWLYNSVIVALGTMLSCTALTLVTGYGFAFKEFPGKNILYWVFLSTLIVPHQAIIIPQYMIIKRLGLVNTLTGMWVIGMLNVVFIIFYRQFLDKMPRELLLTAKVDGANEWQIFSRIILPLSLPTLGAFMIFSFMGSWVNFMWQLVVGTMPEKFTLSVGVAVAAVLEVRPDGLEEFVRVFSISLAGATIAFLPVLMVFIVFQRFFVKDLHSGGIKE